MADSIAAIATSLSPGAISMIRISGDTAIEIADRVFRSSGGKSLQQFSGYTASYGMVLDDRQNTIDDVMAIVYKAPKSYTGEDMVEITCHGGVLITRAVLRRLLLAGAKLAQPGEFSKRAFLNGKMNLAQAESVMELIHANNMDALRSVRAQMDGVLSQQISDIKQKLLQITAHLSAWADYPEEDIQELDLKGLQITLKQIHQQLTELETSFETGKIIRNGVDTVIVGKPNVGKSTLMNRLSQFEKSIVSDAAGTTRDVVEETIQLGAVTLRLSDTAGIRETEDAVEQQGLSRALLKMKSAQLLIAVFDYAKPLDGYDQLLFDSLRQIDAPILAVINKTDLPQKLDDTMITAQVEHVITTSKQDPDTIQKFSDHIRELLQISGVDAGATFLLNERQLDCVCTAKQYLLESIQALEAGMTWDAVTILLESAVHALLELSGERVTEAVVDQVFHHFCVGK